MNDNYVSVRDLRAICKEAPSDAKIMIYSISDTQAEGWIPLTDYEYRYGDGGESVSSLLMYIDGHSYITAQDICDDDGMKEMLPETPLEAFVEYSWNVGEYRELNNIWYEDFDNAIYIGYDE